MKYGAKTRDSHGNPTQNESKSIWITGLCRNLANSIRRNTLAALDSDSYPGFVVSAMNNWGLI